MRRLLARLRRQPSLTWVSQDHDDEPRDQQTDLQGPYWADVGPDARQTPDGWSWTVMSFDDDNFPVATGFADSEAAAKAEVVQWAKQHPASLLAPS